MADNVSEGIYPFVDLINFVAKEAVIPYDKLIHCMLMLVIRNKSKAPKELLSKYLDVVVECLKNVPKDSRTNALRKDFSLNETLNLINLLTAACTNEEASCNIISAMVAGDQVLVKSTVKIVAEMLKDESKFGFGSQLVREMLKVEDDIIDFRSMYVVWYLENTLNYYIDIDLHLMFYAQTLSLFSLLIEICSEHPVCRAKLVENELRLDVRRNVLMYISRLVQYRVGNYVTTSFDTLYLNLKRMLHEGVDDSSDEDDIEIGL